MAKTKMTLAQIQNWNINYSTFVDTLALFSDDINFKSNEELIKKDFDGFSIIYFRNTLEPMLFEMKHASHNLGEIDNLDKQAIIHRVIGYIDNYGN